MDFWQTFFETSIVLVPCALVARRQYRAKSQTSLGFQHFSAPDEQKCQVVVLFSGGLDSLCGAANLVQKNLDAVYVSHSPPGFDSNFQMIQGVCEAFGCKMPDNSNFVSFRLSVNQKFHRREPSMFQEMSRRSRPFFFLSLAAAVALVKKIPKILMSENGALALSLPNRYDTHGPAIARQAHSFILQGFSNLLSDITKTPMRFDFDNPFVSITKGEACEILGPAAHLAFKAMSCEYVGHKRAELLHWISQHSSAARRLCLGNGPQCGLC